jgi:hypothetical protein
MRDSQGGGIVDLDALCSRSPIGTPTQQTIRLSGSTSADSGHERRVERRGGLLVSVLGVLLLGVLVCCKNDMIKK